MICVPFLVPIHGDPYDYGRYTDVYWEQTLTAAGFGEIHIEKQGRFWSVLMDMLRSLAYEMAKEGQPRSAKVRQGIRRLMGWACIKALDWDAATGHQAFLERFTTGFGIVCAKSYAPRQEPMDDSSERTRNGSG